MNDTFERVKRQLRDFEITWAEPDATRLDGAFCTDVLLDVVTLVNAMDRFYLAAMTGLDSTPDGELMEVLYHFCAGSDVVTLRVQCDRIQPVLASICSVVPYASVLERETGEMFGIKFLNAPDSSRLFLPDDWDASIYPLRKDAVLEENDDDNEE